MTSCLVRGEEKGFVCPLNLRLLPRRLGLYHFCQTGTGAALHRMTPRANAILIRWGCKTSYLNTTHADKMDPFLFESALKCKDLELSQTALRSRYLTDTGTAFTRSQQLLGRRLALFCTASSVEVLTTE